MGATIRLKRQDNSNAAFESCDLAANQDNVLDRVYSVNRLGHMTRPDLQHQNTLELNYGHRAAILGRTIRIGCMGTTIEAEQQDDSSVVPIESRDSEISRERGYYPLARLCHMT